MGIQWGSYEREKREREMEKEIRRRRRVMKKEIERLRRFEQAARELVEECRTLTGSLWPQNETTKMLGRVLDEFDKAALDGE